MTRHTIQKQLIHETVYRLRTHPTSEEIYQRICKTYPGISLGTVYRNLNTMAQEGLIHKICVPNGADRFDFNTDAHYHIQCTHCGAFLDVQMDYPHQIDQLVAQATQFEMADGGQDIVFSGICPDCQKG